MRLIIRWAMEIGWRVLLFFAAALVAWFLVKVIYLGWSMQP